MANCSPLSHIQLYVANIRKMLPCMNFDIHVAIYGSYMPSPCLWQVNTPLIAVGRNVPTAIQTYGKFSYFQDFYKISSRSDESQTQYGNYLDQQHCPKNVLLPQQHALRKSIYTKGHNVMAHVIQQNFTHTFEYHFMLPWQISLINEMLTESGWDSMYYTYVHFI